MSIPRNETDPLSAASRRRESDLHLRTQQVMADDNATGMTEFFAFLMELFTGMKSTGGEGLTSQSAVRGFANAFNIDSSRLQKTVDSYKSGEISAYQAARRTFRQTEVSSVDMAAAEKVVAKYAESGNPLLELIADKESGADYNRVYGAGVKRVNLTEMTIDQVQQWQKDYVRNGSPSSAAGKYQIINKTLAGLKKDMGLKGDELFDEKMQDRMAEKLLDGRGYQDYLAGDLPEKDFMENVSKEWASMPKDAGGRSYYAGDGLNKAHATPATLLLAMRHAKSAELAAKNEGELTKEHNGVAVASAKGADAIPENEKDTGTLAQNDQKQPSDDPSLVADAKNPTAEMPAA